MKSRIFTFVTAITLFTVAAIPVRLAAQEQQQAVAISRTPIITSLHPSAASAKSGAGGAVVFVAGQNFVAGSPLFNSSAQPSGPPSSTQRSWLLS